MLNIKPIFIVGFARGGSNILLNILRSHPDVGHWAGEINRVFKGRPIDPPQVRFRTRLRYLPILLAERREIFYAGSWTDRRPFTSFTKKRIDEVLYSGRFKYHQPGANLSDFEDRRYSLEQIRRLRLTTKFLNGLLFLPCNFAEMYPDATYIALVRNGFAVCEGHIRRGRYSPSEIAHFYNIGCQRMIDDSRRVSNYHIFRFEDLISNPSELIKQIYLAADLDIEAVKRLRLQRKPTITAEGKHSFELIKGTHKESVWYALGEVHQYFDPNVNKNQIDRLSEEDKGVIKESSFKSLQYFDYI